MRWQLQLFAVKSYDLEVPFQAAGHGGMGHVGRTDVGGGKPGIPPEMPGIGMEPGLGRELMMSPVLVLQTGNKMPG
ncbi:MAG: hypothetical protein LC657_13505, partial [Desulfobacteraceae bacterium]|nr:hypothetical protein [Desulfobacteraceae bacterium]